jgi:Flp pilus assembly protein TadG
VTVEFAVLMPVMVVLLTAVLATGVAALGYLQCLDAARSGARLAARHEQHDVVVLAAQHLAPTGADVNVDAAGDQVTVSVTAGIVLPLPWHPRLAVTQQATARLEGP